MKYGYARVSTDEQNLDLQTDALREAGCEEIFSDEGISGACTQRPQLDALIEKLEEGDSVTVWRLDRLGRSTLHLVGLVTQWRDMGIEFKSVCDDMDTSTPGGKFYFTIMAALSEMERDLIVGRVTAGMQAAIKRGVHVGRPRKLGADQIALAQDLVASGQTMSYIGRLLKVSRATLYRAMA